MSVRHSLLALLAESETHGYGLKAGFEARTRGTWPLNVGQVYSTLRRLERDGLVEPAPVGPESGEADRSRQTWRITDPGRAELASWFESPRVGDQPPTRDELALKVLLAASGAPRAAARLIHRQRVATMERLQQYTRLKRDADPQRELPWVLLLDSLVLQVEAELKWLDLCEARLDAAGGAP